MPQFRSHHNDKPGGCRRWLPSLSALLAAVTGRRAKQAPITSAVDRIAGRLFERTDIRPLVYFRVAFGAISLWEVYRYFNHGWISRTYIKPKLHFTYSGFSWVRPWPGDGMHVHFLGLGATATLITVGLWYRPAAILFASGFTYVFLLEKARYLNHFYLISLVSWLMVVIPANRAGSLDAWFKPALRSGSAPKWALWLLAGQIAVAYVFGGVAKINWDWLRGEPMRRWVGQCAHLPIIGRYVHEEWMVKLFIYGGLLFDLFIVPLMLWRRTLPLSLPFVFSFHFMNDRLFRIGIFPWFMMASTVLYLPTSWLPWPQSWTRPERLPPVQSLTGGQRAGAVVLAAYALFQILMPLRHHLYPGNVSWTEEGHRFSWHMKLRSKRGTAVFVVTDPASGRVWRIDPGKHLIRSQGQKMATHPDMILQFVRFLERRYAAAGYPNVEVRAEVMVSLNGRNPQPMIDAEVDLTKVRLTLRPSPWIVPLYEPLPEQTGTRKQATLA